MFILSLGTGKIEKPYHYKEAKDWGLVQWVKPVLDIMMTGVSETVDYQLRQIFDAIGKPKEYVRIEPELFDASPDMDNASGDNLRNLKVAGLQAAEENAKLLKEVAAQFV